MFHSNSFTNLLTKLNKKQNAIKTTLFCAQCCLIGKSEIEQEKIIKDVSESLSVYLLGNKNNILVTMFSNFLKSNKNTSIEFLKNYLKAVSVATGQPITKLFSSIVDMIHDIESKDYKASVMINYAENKALIVGLQSQVTQSSRSELIRLSYGQKDISKLNSNITDLVMQNAELMNLSKWAEESDQQINSKNMNRFSKVTGIYFVGTGAFFYLAYKLYQQFRPDWQNLSREDALVMGAFIVLLVYITNTLFSNFMADQLNDVSAQNYKLKKDANKEEIDNMLAQLFDLKLIEDLDAKDDQNRFSLASVKQEKAESKHTVALPKEEKQEIVETKKNKRVHILSEKRKEVAPVKPTQDLNSKKGKEEKIGKGKIEKTEKNDTTESLDYWERDGKKITRHLVQDKTQYDFEASIEMLNEIKDNTVRKQMVKVLKYGKIGIFGDCFRQLGKEQFELKARITDLRGGFIKGEDGRYTLYTINKGLNK